MQIFKSYFSVLKKCEKFNYELFYHHIYDSFLKPM